MSKPFFHFITLFPGTIDNWLGTSILGRAHASGIFDYKIHQLRDYSLDRHKSVDDSAFGGGGGMVLKIEPLVAAIETIKKENKKFVTVYFSPAGKPLNQSLIESTLPRLSNVDWILICGHYEGVDQRFIDHWVDEEISLGDFVLTGGELPALCFVDSLVRNLEGTLCEGGAARESFQRSSHNERLLEYPQYTRPREFRGLTVPEVLLRGNHEEIDAWRHAQSLEKTKRQRPDLLAGGFDKNGQGTP